MTPELIQFTTEVMLKTLAALYLMALVVLAVLGIFAFGVWWRSR
jgi:hypothetical protein